MRKAAVIAATATAYGFGLWSGWMANNLTKPVQWAGKLTEDAPSMLRTLTMGGWRP